MKKAAMRSSGRFDLFTVNDIARYEDLISDPNVVIENRSLSYKEAVEVDGEEAYPAELNLTVYFSQYKKAISTTHYFKRIQLLRSYGLGTSGEILIEAFLDSEEYDIQNTIECFGEGAKYVVIEYIPRNYKIRDDRFSVSRASGDIVTYDESLGCYVPNYIKTESED
jgi:hypothetical protein